MAGAADVSTAVAGAESAAFWDGKMVAFWRGNDEGFPNRSMLLMV